jgi:hypothetical protein
MDSKFSQVPIMATVGQLHSKKHIDFRLTSALLNQSTTRIGEEV